MGRRKKRRTKWGTRAVLLITLFVVIGFTVKSHWSYIAPYDVHLGALGVLLVLLWLLRLTKRLRVAVSLSEIDGMGGHEFERYLVRLFKRLGYRAHNVGSQGADFGADLVIEKEGIRIAVQAKNYLHGRVGNDAVQQAIAGASFYDCHEAMVVTNALFTKAAFKQAERCSLLPVTLWGRRELENILHG